MLPRKRLFQLFLCRDTRSVAGCPRRLLARRRRRGGLPTPHASAWRAAHAACLLASCPQKQRLLASKLPPPGFDLVLLLGLALVLEPLGDGTSGTFAPDVQIDSSERPQLAQTGLGAGKLKIELAPHWPQLAPTNPNWHGSREAQK